MLGGATLAVQAIVLAASLRPPEDPSTPPITSDDAQTGVSKG